LTALLFDLAQAALKITAAGVFFNSVLLVAPCLYPATDASWSVLLAPEPGKPLRYFMRRQY